MDQKSDLGSQIDVAIWGITNPRAAVTLKRVARACVDSGLKTVLLWWKGRGRSALGPTDYPVEGLEYCEVPFRYDLGPFRHPHPLTLLFLSPQVSGWLRMNPVGCVLTQLDHGQVDRVWQYAARKAGIPGIVVQEGMVNVHKSENLPEERANERVAANWLRKHGHQRWLEKIPHGLLRPCLPYMFAEYACVWGEAMKRHLVLAGRDPGTVHVTGSPALDRDSARTAPRPATSRKVLFAQQRMGMPWVERKPFYEELIRTVVLDLKCELLFKLHPNSVSEKGAVRALAMSIGCPPGSCSIIPSGDAVDLLPEVGVLVVASSTTAYHAAVAGVPIVFVDYVSSEISAERTVADGGVVVKRAEELRDAIRAALFDSSVRAKLCESADCWLEDHLFRMDGRAAERVADAICAVLRES